MAVVCGSAFAGHDLALEKLGMPTAQRIRGLTKEALRSPRVRIAGFVLAGRALDNCRATGRRGDCGSGT